MQGDKRRGHKNCDLQCHGEDMLLGSIYMKMKNKDSKIS